MKTKCIHCEKEIDYDGCCNPTMCEECRDNWLKSFTTSYSHLTSPQPQYNMGWVCPKCGAVMAPTERSCINCKGFQDWKITWTGNTGSPTFTNPNVSISGDIKNEC